MFPPTIVSRQPKRSLRELVRGAVDSALEFATLGEAHAPRPTTPRPPAAAPTSEHPHRRRLDRHQRTRRPGTGSPVGRLVVLQKNRRRPTLPGPRRPSTIGAVGLNCSVRNGKRCFPHAKATGNCSRPLGG